MMSEEDRRRFGEVGGWDQFAGNLPAGDPSSATLPRDGRERFTAAGVRATCLAHRRVVKWIPAPGWWVHVADSSSCSAMRGAPSPVLSVMRLGRGDVTGSALSRSRQAAGSLLRGRKAGS